MQKRIQNLAISSGCDSKRRHTIDGTNGCSSLPISKGADQVVIVKIIFTYIFLLRINYIKQTYLQDGLLISWWIVKLSTANAEFTVLPCELNERLTYVATQLKMSNIRYT